MTHWTQRSMFHPNVREITTCDFFCNNDHIIIIGRSVDQNSIINPKQGHFEHSIETVITMADIATAPQPTKVEAPVSSAHDERNQRSDDATATAAAVDTAAAAVSEPQTIAPPKPA